MRRSSRISVTAAFICSSIALINVTAHSQIQFNQNLNLNYSPAVVPCESAVSAKIQTDHDSPAHFEDHTTVTRDMTGNTRVQGSGDYFSAVGRTSFNFACTFDEHNKTVARAFYNEQVVDSERFLPPESQAQDCQVRIVETILGSDSETRPRKVVTLPKSIVIKTKSNGSRVIYGDGQMESNYVPVEFRFNCIYKDGRLIKSDYWKSAGPFYGGAIKPSQVPAH